MIALRAAALVAAALVLTACGHSVEHGVVIDKSYTPAHTSLLPITNTTCSGKPTVCTSSTTWVPIFYADKWSLELRDPHTSDTGWIDVDQAQYDRAVVNETSV